jgi:CheY-like chemotaxis protein
MNNTDGGGSRQKTVMVVDDYDDMRQVTRQALEMFGYRVVEASGGEEAVELARLELPDLILMDLSMPNLDGFATIHLIRRQVGLRDVPFIIVSAHTSREIRADALAFGCRDFITKPINLEKLRAAVLRQLDPDDVSS